jgi:hypothetical protein
MQAGQTPLSGLRSSYCFDSMSNEPLPILALALNMRLLRSAKITTAVMRSMPANVTMKRARIALILPAYFTVG